MSRRRRLPFAAVAAIAGLGVLALAACGSAAADRTPAAPASITVFAAASLTGPFTELAERFEALHPGASVRLSFAGSSDLATQIAEGAPADVFASADAATMARLAEAGLVDAPEALATNVLAIAVPPGNPAGIDSFADLAAPGVRLVACAARVPCGAAAERVARQAGVDLAPVSEESSVTGVLGKVASGEADAGLVYVTDVIGSGGAVEDVPFPEAEGAVNVYPIATVSRAARPAEADAFVAFVLGEEGGAVLAAAGFGPP